MIPPPSVPRFHNEVTLPQEESQEDYGFDPIDFDDPQLNAALQGDTEPGTSVSTGIYLAADKDLAEVGCTAATLVFPDLPIETPPAYPKHLPTSQPPRLYGKKENR